MESTQTSPDLINVPVLFLFENGRCISFFLGKMNLPLSSKLQANLPFSTWLHLRFSTFTSTGFAPLIMLIGFISNLFVTITATSFASGGLNLLEQPSRDNIVKISKKTLTYLYIYKSLLIRLQLDRV